MDSWTIKEIWHQAWLGAYGLDVKELGNPQDKSCQHIKRNGKVVYSQCPANYFYPEAVMKLEPLPHLYIIDFKNEFLFNGQMISERDLLLDLVNRVKPVAPNVVTKKSTEA